MNQLLEFLKNSKKSFAQLHPARQVFLGYLSYTIIGALLLSLPISQSGSPVGVIDNLFTATSHAPPYF